MPTLGDAPRCAECGQYYIPCHCANTFAEELAGVIARYELLLQEAGHAIADKDARITELESYILDLQDAN